MKKLALAFTVVVALVSCNRDVKPSAEYAISSTAEIRVIKIQGHDYLIYDGFKQGGICHSESCPCKSK